MNRLILAGLLSTACAQAFAQPYTLPPAAAFSAASPAASPNSAHPGTCPPTAQAPSRAPSQQSAAAFQAQLQQHLAQLDSVSELCLSSPRFHAQRGLVLQLLGQSADAVEALERALLLEPDQPGTQLDYALALRDAGDATSAQALLLQISQRPDVPPGLQPVLQSQLAALQILRTGPWYQHLKLSTAAGFDSNLNNATSDGQLTLTFPAGDVSLPLADASRAQRGSALMTALQYQAIKPVGGDLWVLQAELRNRSTSVAGTGYQQVDLATQWLQAPEAPSQWQARLGYSNLRFGSADLLHSLRATLVRQWQLAWPTAGNSNSTGNTCRPIAGLEADLRRYPSARPLDGAYSGLLLSVACDAAQASTAPPPAAGLPTDFLYGSNPIVSLPRFSLQLRSGQDRATSAQRPGGNYATTDLRTAAYGRLQIAGMPAFDWVAEYSWLRQRDSTGYSPLLGNNTSRQSTREALRLELSHQLGRNTLAGARWFVSADTSRQASNLAAFSSRGQALYSGLRWNLF